MGGKFPLAATLFVFSADCATAVAAIERDAIFKKFRRELPVDAAELKDDRFRGVINKNSTICCFSVQGKSTA
jgi:hypothetical protein